MTYANRDKYHGEWKTDAKNGEGFYEFASGSVYQGSFKNDLKDGHGVFTARKSVI